MNFLLNVNSKRELREGDVVRAPGNKIGTVVGFSLFENDSVLVKDQFHQVKQYDANGVEFIQERFDLEPLPPIVKILQEDKVGNTYKTCAGGICLHLTETSTTLTLIPKDNSNLRFELRGDIPFCEAVENLLKVSYVTRLPHLVENNPLIDACLMEAKEFEEIFKELEK